MQVLFCLLLFSPTRNYRIECISYLLFSPYYSHVELPFFWQIMKPNLQPLMLEGKVDLTKIKYNQQTESAFSITPVMGLLHPHSDYSFTLSYSPKKVHPRMLLMTVPGSQLYLCICRRPLPPGRVDNIAQRYSCSDKSQASPGEWQLWAGQEGSGVPLMLAAA